MIPQVQPFLWKGASVAVACNTTWNPYDKSAGITLSNSNFTATASTSGDMAVRSFNSFTTGKHYFEVTLGATYTGGDTGPGICTAAANINTFGVNATLGFIVYPSGNIYYNGSLTGIATGALTTNDVLQFAVDLVNKRIWVRINRGGTLFNWNGTVGADPATNTSGFDISAVFGSAAAYPVQAFGPSASGSTSTANFGGSAFASAPPSGFTDWCGPALPRDPSFSNVVLLMGYEGANGSTGAPGMNDESSHAHGTATVSGTSQITTSQFKFGASSLQAGNNTKFPAHIDWQLSTSNSSQFTIECWIKPNSTNINNQGIVVWSIGSPAISFFFWLVNSGNGELGFWGSIATDGNGFDYTPQSSGLTWTVGQWYHVAVDKDAAGKIRIYRNGTMVASATPADSSLFNAAPSYLAIGNDSLGARTFNGYVDEVRITKGVARYASDSGYTVPTSMFPRS